MPPVNFLLARCGHADPERLAAYQNSGGLAALEKAHQLGPRRVIEELETSGLVGRGGAAFPCGRKWAAVAAADAPSKYVICNADESEPGTFKDRKLMEEDPFAVLEALLIAGFAVGASRGYIYVRGEYALAARRLQNALDQLRQGGYLGQFEVELRRGGGAYVCGEETALMNSIEGRRGEPRSKPPFPTERGLFAAPTLMNNVETLVNVPLIVDRGGEWYKSIGTPGLVGPKLFCLSGHVRRPGVYEVAGGTPLRELLEEHAGGVAGRNFQAVLMGGAAGTYLLPDKFDVALDYPALRAVGASIGSGSVIAFNESVDMWAMVTSFAEFFAEESCGQCVPCRLGTHRQVELLHRLASQPAEAGLLRDLGEGMQAASICGLGQTAATQVISALETFSLPGRS
ncbi:MAG: complex I 51 kDa subunit family protein [Chloroflexota bacterium]